MKDKIEEILSKYPVPVYCWDSMIKKLSTLIQAERKEDREMIYKDIQANYHITADEFYKHYLQSLDKGDTDENR